MSRSIRPTIPRPCQRLAALTLALALFFQLAASSLLNARHLSEMALLAELGSTLCRPDAGDPVPGEPSRQLPNCDCCTIGANSSSAGSADLPCVLEVAAWPSHPAGNFGLTLDLPAGGLRYASDISARGPPLESS